MLQTGLHVHDDHVVPAENQAGQQGLEHHVLRAHTAAAAGIHGAHDQQLDAVYVLCQLVGQVGNLRVELIEGVAVVGAGALLGKLLHLGDGDDGVDLLLAQPQGKPQIGVRIHIRRQHRASLGGVEPRQGRGQGGFAHAALARDGNLHIRCPARRAWPRCARSSCRPACRCPARRCSWPRPSPSRRAHPAAGR